MNKENAVQFLPLVKALALGETIQRKDNDGWYDLADVTFNTRPECYRIKPKPMFVAVRDDGVTAFKATDRADTAKSKSAESSGVAGAAAEARWKVYQLVEVPAT